MKKRQQWKESAASALEIPADLAYHDSIVTMTGPREVLIENYRSILKFTSTEIVILTLRGQVSICGNSLEIPWYTPYQMKVTGCVSGIFPQRR